MSEPKSVKELRIVIRNHPEHESNLASHPGRAKTLSLVQNLFTWP
ncbi:hypothetical protein VP01_6062g1, partial [Puccinia sorghi]